MAQITTSVTDWHGTAGDPDEPEVEQQRLKINTECLFRDGSVTATGALAMGGQKITGLGTPTADTDAATKGYVDGVVEGLEYQGMVVARTTAAVDSAGGAVWTLAAGVYTNDALGALSTQDGQTLTAGQRLAIMDGIDVGAGTVQTYNGIVEVTTVGDGSTAAVLTQVDGWGTGDDCALFYFQIDLGTTHEDRFFRVSNDAGSGVVGTDAITFELWSGPGSVETADLADNAVTVGKMAQMAADGLVGNDSGGAADPQHLTVAEANLLLNVATSTAPGTVEIATTAEVDTGTDDARAISPLALAGSAPAILGTNIQDVVSIKESGGQTLTVGSVPDTTLLIRSGTGIIGQVPPILGRWTATDSQLTGDGLGATTEGAHTAVTVSAGFLHEQYRMVAGRAVMVVDSDNGADNWTIRLRVGGLAGTLFYTGPVQNISAGQTITFDYKLVITSIGAGGTFTAMTAMSYPGYSGSPSLNDLQGGSVDTTGTVDIVVTGESSSASAAQQVTMLVHDVQVYDF